MSSPELEWNSKIENSTHFYFLNTWTRRDWWKHLKFANFQMKSNINYAATSITFHKGGKHPKSKLILLFGKEIYRWLEHIICKWLPGSRFDKFKTLLPLSLNSNRVTVVHWLVCHLAQDLEIPVQILAWRKHYILSHVYWVRICILGPNMQCWMHI